MKTKCKAKTRGGTPCKLDAVVGGYCVVHYSKTGLLKSNQGSYFHSVRKRPMPIIKIKKGRKISAYTSRELSFEEDNI